MTTAPPILMPALPPSRLDVLDAMRTRVQTLLRRTEGDDDARERLIRFQALTAELATGFIGLSGDELDTALGSALERIATFAGAERALLVRLEPQSETMQVTHDWTAGAPASLLRPLHGLRMFRWTLAQLRNGRLLHYENRDDLPAEATEERRGWEIFGLQSILAVPVQSHAGDLIGFAVFATTTRKAGWKSEELPLFDLVAEMLRSTFEQQKLRGELERSELRLRKLLESGAIGILSAANDGRILEANDAALAVLGISRADLDAGKLRWDQITPPEYLPMTMSALEQVERSGCSEPFEQDVYRPDGSRVSILVCLAKIAETPQHFLVYAVDITVDKQAQRELALRNRLARLITLFSTRLIAVAPSRIGETIEEALRETGGVLGIDRATVWLFDEHDRAHCSWVWDRERPSPGPGRLPPVERSMFPIWDEDFRARRPMVVPDTAQSFSEESAERRFLERYGIRSGVAVPLVGGGDMAIGFVTFGSGRVQPWPEATVSLLCVIGEIFATAIVRGRTEEKQRRVHAELEERIIERTTQLESANRELEAFSYAVSHDLRAPLRSVDGFSRILVEDYAQGLPSDARNLLDRIRNTSQRMGELIDALLKLSRITRSEPQFERTNLSAIARELAASLAAAEPERLVDFRIEDGIVVDGEPRLLTALLDNLLRNAWKFTAPKSRAQIEFCTDRRDGRRVFCVSDNGVGFDPSQAARIFTPFQRLHDPREFDGHGVGLATVKRIVGVHGGRVWGTGKPGEGAIIQFTLGERA